MIQFLNNIWIALSSENVELVNTLLIPAGIVENYLIMELFLTLFNVKTSIKSKFLYVSTILVASIITLNFIPSPYNIFVNYSIMIILIRFFFKLNLLKTFIALIFPSAIFGLLNVLLQNPYITLLDISFGEFMNTPLYRVLYLILLYFCAFLIILILQKRKNIRLTLDLFDTLDKKTKIILYINLFIGFLTLFIQIITTAFYIDIVPIIITILNFILLISFFIISIYTFTRVVKLANTRKSLECVEEYNKSLEIMYDKVKGFKHDFDNIVSTLDGFIENNDITGLKNYFYDVKKDCKITNNLSILNPRIINNPGIYSLLNNKYFKATHSGITFEIEYFIDLDKLEINLYEFSRILGILIDNAIEEAKKEKDKFVKITFLTENKNNRTIITVKNTYSNKNVDTEEIFKKGISNKDNHSGIGLWEVRNYVKKSKNLDLFTSKDNNFFKQELSIYNL